MEDKRQARAPRVLKGDKITFHGHASTIDCTVRNLTATGACLNVASPVGNPSNVRLEFGQRPDAASMPRGLVEGRQDRSGVRQRPLPMNGEKTPAVPARRPRGHGASFAHLSRLPIKFAHEIPLAPISNYVGTYVRTAGRPLLRGGQLNLRPRLLHSSITRTRSGGGRTKFILGCEDGALFQPSSVAAPEIARNNPSHVSSWEHVWLEAGSQQRVEIFPWIKGCVASLFVLPTCCRRQEIARSGDEATPTTRPISLDSRCSVL